MAPFGALFQAGEGRRLLDFGCGNGLFLELAHGRGFDIYGVDLAEDAVAAARQRPGGAHTYHGAPGEIPEIAAGGFDVITMWSVLAHLAEPVEDLTMLRRLLAPGRSPAPAHRQRRIAEAQAPARDVGRVHAEPPDLLLAGNPPAAAPARRVRRRRHAALVRRAGRARHLAPL